MSQSLDEELSALKKKILKMGHLIETQIANAVKSLVETDLSLAEQTVKDDDLANALDVEINGDCIHLLESHSPTASDLRFITTAMKISTDLEHMGDLAEDICKQAIELSQEPLLKPYIDIPRMADAAKKMVREMLDAFVNQDVALARKVCEADAFIDDLTSRIFQELLSYMVGDSATIARAIRISSVSNYIECIGNHATDGAEMVICLLEEKTIRHSNIEATD